MTKFKKETQEKGDESGTRVLLNTKKHNGTIRQLKRVVLLNTKNSRRRVEQILHPM